LMKPARTPANRTVTGVIRRRYLTVQAVKLSSVSAKAAVSTKPASSELRVTTERVHGRFSNTLFLTARGTQVPIRIFLTISLQVLCFQNLPEFFNIFSEKIFSAETPDQCPVSNRVPGSGEKQRK